MQASPRNITTDPVAPTQNELNIAQVCGECHQLMGRCLPRCLARKCREQAEFIVADMPEDGAFGRIEIERLRKASR
jgi:hypothetical protein